jgi:ABC-type dipeptide/oligopeptide/nickel transport system ATPase component
MEPLLSVRLSADYPAKAGVLRDVAFDVAPGEIAGLAGESGSGKSTVALAILGLLGYKGGKAHGQILFQGRNLLDLTNREWRKVRGREIGLVLQSPLLSLNPALKLGTAMAEAWRAHAAKPNQWREQAIETFRLVSLANGEELLNRYPRELSVGQAQRALIAMAILHRPRLLIADEATSALDAITQSEILQLFRSLNQALGMSLLFISHDLMSLATLCHRMAILQNGILVESGTTEQIFNAPVHPYTQALLRALPRLPLSPQDAGGDALAALAKHVHSTSVSVTSFSTLIE